MARRVFYSFHFDADVARAAQVRSMGVIEGNVPASDNDWEAVKRGGDAAIQRWIDNQLSGTSCAVVLVGAQTAGRKWIKYEIQKAWSEGKGLVGVHIHNLKNLAGQQAYRGTNPFAEFSLGPTPLSSIVRLYDPPYSDSKLVYGHIRENLASWIEEAIAIRNRY